MIALKLKLPSICWFLKNILQAPPPTPWTEEISIALKVLDNVVCVGGKPASANLVLALNVIDVPSDKDSKVLSIEVPFLSTSLTSI